MDGDAVPIFTSEQTLEAASGEPHAFVTIQGRALFEMLPQQRFIINPANDYGKELLPDEVAALLDGSIFEE